MTDSAIKVTATISTMEVRSLTGQSLHDARQCKVPGPGPGVYAL
jgi:hypothetical protein